MKRHVLLVGTFAISTCFAQQAPTQDEFDEWVGYAYGFTEGTTYASKRCAEQYPEATETIRDALRIWKSINVLALFEIQAQWDAYVERDAAVSNIPPKSYYRFLERKGGEMIENQFKAIGGFQSPAGKERCVNFDKILNTAAFRLESKLEKELKAFRSCKQTGLCSNMH